MYKLIGDESGLNEREKMCVVAGFVGSADQWNRFDVEWQQVLDEFKVDVFHGIDFFDWHLDDAKNVVREHPYEGWTEVDDFEFIDALLQTTESAGLYKAGTAVNISLWFELTEDERRYLTTSGLYDKNWQKRGQPSDPWYAAFQGAIITAAKHFVPSGEKVYPFFDRRDSPDRKKQPKHDKAKELYNEMLNQQPSLEVREKLGDILTFASKETLRGLQAADLICNRARVYVAEGLGEDPLSNRLRDFMEKGRGYVRMLGLRGLDLALRGCPFRSTFWKVEEFTTAEPDYLERMRWAGVNVVAFKGARTGRYYSHHVRREKVTKVKKMGVSPSGLVYIEGHES